MKTIAFIYDSGEMGPTVDAVLTWLKDRQEPVNRIDVATDGNVREAMLLLGESTRIGPKPDAVFDDDGNPDFSDGVLITEQETGRRTVRIGDDMLEVV